MILIYIQDSLRYNVAIGVQHVPDRMSSATGAVLFDDLPATERLIIVALRTRIESSHCAGQLRTLWRIACGLVGMEAAVRGFEGMVAVLARGARRSLAIRAVAEPHVSHDELAVVSLLAASQHGAPAHADILAEWLVRGAERRVLAREAACLAGALAVAGRPLALGWLMARRPCGPATAFAHRAPPPREPDAETYTAHRLNSSEN